MWTTSNRGMHDRRNLRYPGDLSDAESAFVAPMIPPAKRGGRPRTVNVREVLNGIFYVLSTGCQCRLENRDRQTLRHCQGVRGVTQTIDRRAYLRLARPLPPSGKGLREPRQASARFPPPRTDS